MSPRTLVVGTPQRIHYAFDIQSSRLGRAWVGRFFDAAGTWKGRAGVLQMPPVDWIEFAPGAPFALLSDRQAPWPSELGRDAGYRVLGRKMNEDDLPTFRYAMGDLLIEETPLPELRAGGARLVRHFNLQGSSNSPGALHLRAARGRIEEREGEWILDDEVTLTVTGDGLPILRGEGDAAELLIKVPEAPARFQVSYTW
jgi:hypothetical protein